MGYNKKMSTLQDQLSDAIAQKNSDFLKTLSPEVFNSMSYQDFHLACNECVKIDWSAGLSLIREASKDGKHGWAWHHPTVSQPGHILFRAMHFAKPSCLRELVKGAKPETLVHCILMGSSNVDRPLKITQNRIRCFSYIAKEFLEWPDKTRLKFLDDNPTAVRAILENNNTDIIKIFLNMSDIKNFWSSLWSAKKNYMQKDRPSLAKSRQSLEWSQAVESLWQATSLLDDIPQEIKKDIFSMISVPDNQSFFPRIHSEISKKEIHQALNLSEKIPTKNKKRL